MWSGIRPGIPEVVRRVEVVERGDDGTATKARTTLHVSQGPFNRDIDLLLSVQTEPAGIGPAHADTP